MTLASPKVAILGAGLCGLLIAKGLQKLGTSPMVFEKSRGTGGRLATKRWPWGQANIGAQYFTARDEEFRALVDTWVKEGHAKRWAFTPYKIHRQQLLASPDDVERFVGSPSMTSITRYLANGINLALSTRIEECKLASNGTWELLDNSGNRHGPFDIVISTLPAEQTHALFAEHTEQHRTIHRPCWAVVLATSCADGSQIPADIQGIFGDDQFSWVSRQSALQNLPSTREFSDIWLLHSAPEWTENQSSTIATRVNALAKEWLENVFKKKLNVVHNEQHFWRYANIAGAPNAEIRVPSDDSVVSSNLESLLITGAWQHSGKVEGAFLAAQHCIEKLKLSLGETQG